MYPGGCYGSRRGRSCSGSVRGAIQTRPCRVYWRGAEMLPLVSLGSAPHASHGPSPSKGAPQLGHWNRGGPSGGTVGGGVVGQRQRERRRQDGGTGRGTASACHR